MLNTMWMKERVAEMVMKTRMSEMINMLKIRLIRNIKKKANMKGLMRIIKQAWDLQHSNSSLMDLIS